MVMHDQLDWRVNNSLGNLTKCDLLFNEWSVWYRPKYVKMILIYAIEYQWKLNLCVLLKLPMLRKRNVLDLNRLYTLINNFTVVFKSRPRLNVSWNGILWNTHISSADYLLYHNDIWAAQFLAGNNRLQHDRIDPGVKGILDMNGAFIAYITHFNI